MSKRVPARCTKIRYANEAIATDALRRLNERRERQGNRPAHLYRCPLCRGYHQTTKRSAARP